MTLGDFQTYNVHKYFLENLLNS